MAPKFGGRRIWKGIHDQLTVDVDAEARPELQLGQFGVRVEVAVMPEVPGARPVPRRPARVAHRHPEVAKLALAEHTVSADGKHFLLARNPCFSRMNSPLSLVKPCREQLKQPMS